jgi:hypothetical protein
MPLRLVYSVFLRERVAANRIIVISSRNSAFELPARSASLVAQCYYFRFAVRTVEQAQTYWNLLEKVPPKTLKLTRYDDEIFEHTLKAFPELADDEHIKLTKIDEELMKSEDGKRRWREFSESSVT